MCDHVDDALNVSVDSVDQHSFTGGPAEDTVTGGTEEQREAIRSWLAHEGWDAFCAECGATPAPEFRARLKQSFLSEAESDARRRRAYKLSILGLPRFYINLAAVGAAAALILMVFTHSTWFRPAPAVQTAEEIHGTLLGPRSGALGFAPDAGDTADAVYVEYSTPLTDEVQGALELIAAEAGGAVELAGDGGSTGEAQAMVLTVPSDVLDHVLGRLGEAIGAATISKPAHLNSERVTVYITFSPD